jgi:hydrogenase maturation protease
LARKDPQKPEHGDQADSGPDKDIEVLVLGVGNDMMGDEGIGVRVVRELKNSYEFSSAVEIADGGVGGLSLLPLIRSAEEVVIVDAVDAEAKPGSIFMFNTEELEVDKQAKMTMHDTGILEVIRTAALMEEGLDATVIGVQPKKMDEFGGELSRAVSRKLPRIIEIILELLASRGLFPEAQSSCTFVKPSELEDRA